VASRVRGTLDRPGRLEQFCHGTPASVALLCGPSARLPLLPCAQHLSADGRFHYFGGLCPLDAALCNRAERLAVKTIDTLSGPLGYLGVDLVLGADPSGAEDRVIEINPRLTTSYVGLRAVSAVNLAGTMLDVAQRRPTRLSWRDRRVEFLCTGEVRELLVAPRM
jgi:predicted ATP-grasp superfamily ATP-dependent carboligase